jgi:hypothetical protein
MPKLCAKQKQKESKQGASFSKVKDASLLSLF